MNTNKFYAVVGVVRHWSPTVHSPVAVIFLYRVKGVVFMDSAFYLCLSLYEGHKSTPIELPLKV